MEIKTGKPCHASNYTKGRSQSIKYIVIHFTSNNGDTAANNVNYFAGANRKASAHYFVDENSIYRSVKDSDTAWHCGTSGKYYHSSCRNAYTIGIEMCSRIAGGQYYIKPETVTNTISLTKQLMKQYGIPASNVVRHYDVTHKSCPKPFVRNTSLWEDFKNKLIEETEGDEMIRDEFEAYKKSTNDIINAIGQENAEIKKKIASLEQNHNEFIYNYVDENMPQWAHMPITWFMQKGILKGENDGKLGLTYKDLRIYTIMYRMAQVLAKMFGCKIE